MRMRRATFRPWTDLAKRCGARRSSNPIARALRSHSVTSCERIGELSAQSGYLAVGSANSAPFGVLSGQRCMIDFCRV